MKFRQKTKKFIFYFSFFVNTFGSTGDKERHLKIRYIFQPMNDEHKFSMYELPRQPSNFHVSRRHLFVND